MRVTALDGTEWKVTRRADGINVAAAIVFLLITIAGWVVAFVFVLPAVLLLVEVALLLIVFAPREYVVAAHNTTTGEVRSERIHGRRVSKRAERDLARDLSGLA